MWLPYPPHLCAKAGKAFGGQLAFSFFWHEYREDVRDIHPDGFALNPIAIMGRITLRYINSIA